MTRTNEIESIIGYNFRDKDLLETAFTHSSYTNEHHVENNEKLEFLGDSILNFIIAELLYLTSLEDEGAMSISRASIVSRVPLAMAIDRLGLLKYLKIGVGVSKNKNFSTKFRSNLFEAILGAIYLDGGMESAKRFVYNHLGQDITNTSIMDYKSRLQEIKQEKFNDMKLEYVTIDNGRKEFVSKVYLGGEILGEGKGKRKKIAEREAAKIAIKKLNFS